MQRVFAGTAEYPSLVEGTVFVIHQIFPDRLLEYSPKAVVEPASLERFVYFRNELRRRLLAGSQRVRILDVLGRSAIPGYVVGVKFP